MFCTQCGTNLTLDTKFCTNCGSRLDDPEERGSGPVATMSKASSQSSPTQMPSRSSRSDAVGLSAPGTKAVKSMVLWGGIALLGIAAAVTVVLIHRRASPPPMSDSQIVEALQSKFASDPNLRNCTLEVHSERGVVTLIGQVSTEADKSAAASIAAQMPDVKEVKIYQLIVKRSAAGETLETGSPPAVATNLPPITAGSRTITVPAKQGWTATSIFLRTGDVVTI